MSNDGAPVLQVGPHTLRLAGRTLEQAMGAVWQAIIETHGYDPAEGWEVRVDGIVLMRKRETAAPPEGGTPMEPSPQLPAPLLEEQRDGRPPTQDDHGRWCPYCGADLSSVPVREEPPDEALFATTGRRLKVALAVAFVLVWLALSVLDWLSEPAALVIPGWFSALGALMLFYLLGLDPMRFLRRRH